MAHSHDVSDTSSDSNFEIEGEDESWINTPSGQYAVGDYVVVKFVGKSKEYFYIGIIDTIDDMEFEGRFMRKVNNKAQTFVFKAGDKSSFEKDDILVKLPKPCVVGGTRRKAHQLKFPIDLTMWSLE